MGAPQRENPTLSGEIGAPQSVRGAHTLGVLALHVVPRTRSSRGPAGAH